MKTKTIERALTVKFEDFLKSIKDDDLRVALKNGCIITGGAITSLLLNEEVKDYDLYFTNKDLVKRVAEYYVEEFKKLYGGKGKIFNVASGSNVSISVKETDDRIQIYIGSAGVVGATTEENTEDNTEDNMEDENEGIAIPEIPPQERNAAEYQYFEQLPAGSPEQENFIDNTLTYIKGTKKVKNKKYVPLLLTSNAITLSDDIQLVIRFYGDAEEIHNNYDFVHCTNYWKSKNNKLYLNQPALESILTKNLVYQGSLYPLCSLFRIRKFIQRGWTINAGQILKIALNLQQFDLNNVNVLREQLIGVDIAYFYELISKLTSGEEDIDYIYICRLIDEVF